MPKERFTSPRWHRVLLLLLLALATASTSWANLPLAGQHYPNGAEDFVVGALPPPGVYLKNYFALFQKDHLYDGSGDKQDADFEADVMAVVPRFIWVTEKTLFGASYGVQAFFPLHYTNVRSDAIGSVDPKWTDAENAGLGDIIFTPLILGWHFSPSFHMVAALDIWAPTGDYHSNDPASQVLSKNHWTFEPVVALSYLKNGWDFSVKLMYDFNTTNDNYRLPALPLGPGGGSLQGELDPGNEFHFDWAISYARKEGLRFGLSGYSYWQTSKDDFDPDAAGIPNIKEDKGQVHAIGPTIKYWPNQGRFSATLKHQWEYGAEALPEGQTTWLNVIWVF